MIRRRPRLRLVESERDMMRAAGRFNAQLMDFVRPQVQAGVRTEELDRVIYEYTLDHGHTPACLGYRGDKRPFPKSCCISVNDVVCHGIPDDYELKDGDIVNIDVTTMVEGWHGDQSETFVLEPISSEARQLVQCAFDALYAAIEALRPDCQVAVIGETITAFVAQHYGFGVVEKYVGHGIGNRFHQKPNIPHVPNRQSYLDRLYPGMCFTIEPMVNGGKALTVVDRRDGWTVRTADGRWSAQFEHTVLMTESGPEILTLTQAGPQRGHRF